MKKIAEEELSIKVVRASGLTRPQPTIWQRFDRLQRSVAPLRKGKCLSRGIHYGSGS